MAEPIYQEPTDKDIMAVHVEALEADNAALRSYADELADEVAALEGLVDTYDGNFRTVSKKCDELRADKAALEQRVERLEEALESIVQWFDAYPLDIFPKPDFEKAHELLKAGGMIFAAISASNMRHVVEGVGEIAKEALAESNLSTLTTQQKPNAEEMEKA